ncbi:MAG: alkaline phosphatase [Planctomycetota bacterium]
MKTIDWRPYAPFISLIPVALLLAVFAATRPEASPAVSPAQEDTPYNVIFLIGDGMGPQQVGLLQDWATAAGRRTTALGTLMNQGEIGVVRTRSIDSPATDSAAAATALACGVSTANGRIAQLVDGTNVRTAMEDAIESGYRTGLVTTTAITHATPACFITHIDHRDKEPEIAQQLVESEVDVVLGGGAKYFTSQRQDLRGRIAARGWEFVRTEPELDSVPRGAKVFGLFSKGHFPYAIDRDQPGEKEAPTLARMTESALHHLHDPNRPFFVMIEGGRIDHAGHANDVAAMLGEMREFDDAVEVALRYQRRHPRTLVIVTADHETGGLCITYGLNGTITDEDFLAMAAAECSVEEAIDRGTLRLGPTNPEPLGVGRESFYAIAYRAANYTALEHSAKWNVSFGSGNHSTTPVYVLAKGPGQGCFAGVQFNTRIGQTLRKWMSVRPPE